MEMTHSKLVPIAFWIAFVALGLVTSLGSPQKRVSHAPKATHSFNAVTPNAAAIALRAGPASRDSRSGRFQLDAVQHD